MPRKADTHIRVTEETWSRLNRLKGPGDSFNDVIEALLAADEGDEGEDGPEGESDGEPDGGRRRARP